MSSPTPERLELTFQVRNTGRRPGWAVPQLYLHRTQGAVTSRVRQLCGFDACRLAPGETKTVTLPFPRETLLQWYAAMVRRLLPGRIQWFLGDHGETCLEGAFVLP